ncbi:DMT family transporter [Nocardioides aquiterrae]|uniref:EamA family transporter n=1 Tax=Nocardioides aquiterrae TaxID=203799 RepID=A0ABN1UC77_9ACTN
MGPLLVLLSATCFGAMAVLGKLAYEEGVPPTTLVLLRFVIAALVLGGAVAVAARMGRPALPARPGGERRRLALTALALGCVGYAAQASFYFAALERIDAALVALVLYTFPVMVTVASVLLGRDRLTPPRVAALVAATCGTALVLVGAGGLAFHAAGVGLAFAAAVTYTGYILVGDSTVQRVPPLTLTALVMTGAAVTLAVRALLTGGLDVDIRPVGWLWIGCIALVSTVVASTAFFAGLHRTGPSTASILSTFEPVATVVLAAVVLGERLSPVQAVGGALVLSSVLLVQLRRRTPLPPGDAPGVPTGARR